LPFLAHAAIEAPASLSFMLTPSVQLPDLSPAASLILQQYGALLLASVVVAAAIGFRAASVDEPTRRAVAAALAFYHIWPARRALVRLSSVVNGGLAPAVNNNTVFGGPEVHLFVHVVCFMLLFGVTVKHGLR